MSILHLTLFGAVLLLGSLALLLHAHFAAPRARLDRRLAALAGPGAPQRAETGWAGLAERLLTTSARDRQEIAAGLQAAGHDAPSGVALFALLRAGACAVGAAASGWYAAGSAMSGGRILVYALCGAAAGFLIAKAVLGARGRAGQRQVYRELPFLLDTLLLLLESGISLDQSFRYIVQQRLGGLDRTRRSMEGLVDDLQNGMQHDAALRRWAGRLAVPGARDLAGLFGQALVHGSEIGPALREYVREFADRRTAAARAGVGKQTTIMTAVLVVFLMPAVMIMLAGPAVVSLKDALGKLSRQAMHGRVVPGPVIPTPSNPARGGRP